MNEYLLRSLLFVPAYRKKFIDSALKCDADALIIDLEDAVPSEYKADARVILKEYILGGAFQDRTVFVRLNSIESKMLFEDIETVLNEDIDGVMLTKIYSEDDMIYYDKLFTQFEEEKGLEQGHFKFLPLIETTSAVLNVFSIAKASKRTIAVCFGGEDYLNDLVGLHKNPPRSFDYPRAQIAVAARAAGILPIDTPYLALSDEEGFIQEEKVSFEMGYAGALLIHPKQIPLAHKCFVPEEEEIERSKQIVNAIEEAKKTGSGVTMLNGKMIGPPMRKRAEKVLHIMGLIEKNEKNEKN